MLTLLNKERLGSTERSDTRKGISYPKDRINELGRNS
jgi:hypothetical protein